MRRCAGSCRFRGSSFAELDRNALTLSPSGLVLRPARVVALPLLDGPQITGVPADAHGFIPRHRARRGAGSRRRLRRRDVTAYPIKHGGLAAQQADVVASAIAARAGSAIAAQPLMPVLRGVLLTGGSPLYLEAELSDGGGFSSSVSDVCPWDPPTKIVARCLDVPRARAGGRRADAGAAA